MFKAFIMKLEKGYIGSSPTLNTNFHFKIRANSVPYV